ncbi:hypothetical protein LHK_00297 [Laribacter hongkongensis HLHK9]|uniref:Uncharacterized protein n=1 Tax=Laribacter hongkongensis (strain HLHK9) TaxID=557598 RepID=C1DAW1_LARHH|nr:hypothetical protein LHK_00297 [Laribacter hongkongensis HLHK9]
MAFENVAADHGRYRKANQQLQHDAPLKLSNANLLMLNAMQHGILAKN